MELKIKEKYQEGILPITNVDTHQEVCDELARLLQSSILNAATTGLYLASPDAGMQPSVAFWKLALEQGPGFVSPQNFPLTLANGPAAMLSIKLGLKGPCYTLLGEESALESARDHAQWDLENNIISCGVVLWIDFSFCAENETSYRYEIISA